MEDDFCLFRLNEIQGDYRPLKGIENEEVVTQGKQASIFEIDESGELDPFCFDIGNDIHTANLAETRVDFFEDQQQTISDYWMQNGLHHHTNANGMLQPVKSVFQATKNGLLPNHHSGVSPPIKLKPNPISRTSFKLLSKYRRGNLKPRNGNSSNLSSEYTVSGWKLSTEEIMRVAGEIYIQFSNKQIDAISWPITTFIHPYGSALSNLSAEENRGAYLAHLLLSAAEKVGYKKFDSASRLLTHCECIASETGNPVERTAFYFAEALQERINRETGSLTIKKTSEEVREPIGLSSGAYFTVLAAHQEVPFSKVMQFASMQTILDIISLTTKVHLIDLQIRSGIQWTLLMQDLSERKNLPIEHLKITALDTKDEQKVEETGKRLENFAESLNIPFSFKVVFVSDIKDLREEFFDIKPCEAVAVYAPTVLRTMISRPASLENLMRVIQRLSPSIMVVSEVESNHNSTSFVSRFIEALFYYSSWFDCLDDCMDRENQYRMDLEKNQLGQAIHNIVAMEGEERITRSVKTNMWRSYFARFKMVEVELSKSSLHQANLVLKQQFSCGSSCTLNKSDKCLIVEWKGTPIFSLSTWKFK